MSESPAVYNADNAALLETVLVRGDLKDLSPAQRLSYYKQVCESVGLNPLTKPFQYITLNGRLTLYATRDATDQLRGKPRMVNITKLERETTEGVYVVTAYAVDKDGRTDSSIGAVAIEGLKGEARANAMMKAETKAKRRVTLSLCGLGMLDETEVESIPDARPVHVAETGEIVDSTAKPTPPDPPPSRPAIIALIRIRKNDLESKAINYPALPKGNDPRDYATTELEDYLALLDGLLEEAANRPKQEAMV